MKFKSSDWVILTFQVDANEQCKFVLGVFRGLIARFAGRKFVSFWPPFLIEESTGGLVINGRCSAQSATKNAEGVLSK